MPFFPFLGEARFVLFGFPKLGKTNAIHIEFWFKLVPAKVHEVTTCWFGLPDST